MFLITRGVSLSSWVKLPNLLTFPAPEQFWHLSVLGTRKGWSVALDSEMGLMLKHTPLAEQRAQAKYPVYVIQQICYKISDAACKTNASSPFPSGK